MQPRSLVPSEVEILELDKTDLRGAMANQVEPQNLGGMKQGPQMDPACAFLGDPQHFTLSWTQLGVSGCVLPPHSQGQQEGRLVLLRFKRLDCTMIRQGCWWDMGVSD